MIRRILLALMMTLAGIGTVAVASAPAQADTSQEILDGCSHTGPSIGSAGYYVNFGGADIAVTITVGWQYTGGSSSACEDINMSSATEEGVLWTHGVFKVRTYMCNSAGSCWYNAWRNCQGGCTAAENMANGVKYQVHFASFQSVGLWVHEYD